MLAAAERNMGGCIIGSIRREELREIFRLPEEIRIHLVLALGYPKETVVIEPLGKNGDTRYWRDDRGFHHVPKRSLAEVIIRR